MKSRWFRFAKDESGQVLVLFALLLTVIFGFTALAIDVGAVVNEKSKLQNAADAAALAGAQDLPGTQAKSTAKDYAEKNGAEKSNTTAKIIEDSTKIEVICTKKVPYSFARVLGFTEADISARAVAEKSGSIGAAFNYAVFHGSEDEPLKFNSSSIDVDGDLHSNQEIKFYSLYANIKGTLEAVSKLTINSATVDIKDVCQVSSINNNSSTLNVQGSTIESPASVIEMPDFSDILKEEAQTGITYNGNKTFNSGNFTFNEPIYVTGDLTLNSGNFYFDRPIFVEGKLTINSTYFIGKGIIYAKDDIVVNSASFASTAGTVSLYCGEGDIELNSMWADINGFIYAPNGAINMKSMSSKVTGSVIGNEIKLNSGYLKVNYGDGNYDGLPKGGSVKLVE